MVKKLYEILHILVRSELFLIPKFRVTLIACGHASGGSRMDRGSLRGNTAGRGEEGAGSHWIEEARRPLDGHPTVTACASTFF